MNRDEWDPVGSEWMTFLAIAFWTILLGAPLLIVALITHYR